MILVRPSEYSSFEEYRAALSKPARKNWRAANSLYSHLQYKRAPFDRDRVEQYMKLWGQQLVRGKTIEWAFGVGYVCELADKGEILFFDAGIAGQFLQKRDGYWEAHPPMYDKRNGGLGTWMWFKLFEYGIENRLLPIDMGGGSDDWVYNLKQRASLPNTTYKWRFVPEDAKRNPDAQPKYFIGRPLCKLQLRD